MYAFGAFGRLLDRVLAVLDALVGERLALIAHDLDVIVQVVPDERRTSATLASGFFGSASTRLPYQSLASTNLPVFDAMMPSVLKTSGSFFVDLRLVEVRTAAS